MKFKYLIIPLLIISLGTCRTIERPQTPTPPFNYIIEEVTVTNTIDNIELNGILTIPSDTDDFPVVILVSGSGPNNYDEEWAGHKPFRVIADYLTKNGIGVLRMNDRDFDKEPVDFYQNTTEDFVKDVLSGIVFLQNHENTKNSPIGLIGHSEGGIVSSMATVENPDVSFLILLGTPGMTLDKVNSAAAELSYELYGAPGKARDILFEFQREYDEIVRNYQSDKEAKEQAERLYDSFFKNTEMFDRNDRYNLMTKVTLPWYRYMYKNDPANYFNKLYIPVLFIIGEFDSQITPDENLQIARNCFNEKNDLSKILKMDNLNHMLQPAESYEDYSSIKETVSIELLEEILKWIQKLTENRISHEQSLAKPLEIKN